MNPFQSKLVYANGVSVSVKLTKQFETISSDPGSDRSYVNAQFFVFFSEKKIFRRIKKGLSREQVLDEFRQSDRYEIMKGIKIIANYSITMIFKYRNDSLKFEVSWLIIALILAFNNFIKLILTIFHSYYFLQQCFKTEPVR